MEQTPVQIAKTPLEIARKEYHDATVEMANIDAKLIDATAGVEELREAHAKSIERVNQAREKLIDARSPQLPKAAPTAEDKPESLQGVLGTALRRTEMISCIVDGADFIQDEAPGLATYGSIWVRPSAREAVKLGSDAMWHSLKELTADIQALLDADEIRACTQDPRWIARKAAA